MKLNGENLYFNNQILKTVKSKTKEQAAEEWAKDEIDKLNTPENKAELEKDFLNFIAYGKSKTHIDSKGNIKSLDPWD